MKNNLWILLVASALAAPGAGAQETARMRAERTLPAPVFQEIATLASDLEASGIPGEPLFAKALEGAAKRVPQDRLVPAVRDYAGRLGQSRAALGRSSRNAYG